MCFIRQSSYEGSIFGEKYIWLIRSLPSFNKIAFEDRIDSVLFLGISKWLLKVNFSHSTKISFICFNESPLKMIIYEKTDEWYKEWQRVVQRVVQRVTASGATSHNEWQWVVQRMTTSDNEWYNEWQRVVQRVTTSDNKWQWVTESDSSGTTIENGTVHFKEWMIAIPSMTETDTLLLQLEWLNK